jgi:uncharacterized protein
LIKSEFYLSFVRHTRYFPKKYLFDYRFFWTKFNLDELDELDRSTFFFSRNGFNLVSFYDRDHISLGHKTTRENIEAFLRENDVQEEIVTIELVTNPRILGYTFNPVSFYFIQTTSLSYLVIEIGNTFHELKPYLVGPENKNTEGEWTFTTPKYFYISPFTSLENTMTFRIRRNQRSLVINIDDFAKDQLELRASFTGQATPWSSRNLLKLFLSYPLITLRIIWSIHYHALRLYLLKIPFWKKSDNCHLQKDYYLRKDGTFTKKS